MPLFALQAQVDSVVILLPVPVQAYRIEVPSAFKQSSYKGDSLKKFGVNDMASLFKRFTPVFVRSNGVSGVSTLSVRGTGSNHAAIYWNGLEINAPNLGLSDLSILNTSGSQDLSLLYGVGSIAEGNGALGGALQLRDRADFNSGWKGSLRQEIGSFGRSESNFSLQYSNTKWSFRNEAQYFAALNNYPFIDVSRAGQARAVLPENPWERLSFKQNLDYRVGFDKLLSVRWWFQQSERDLLAPIIGDLSASDRMRDRHFYAVTEWQQPLLRGIWWTNLGLVSQANHFQLYGDSLWQRNDFNHWQFNTRWKRKNKGHLYELALQARQMQAISPGYQAQAQRSILGLFGRWDKAWNAKMGHQFMARYNYNTDFTTVPTGAIALYYKWSAKEQLSLNFGQNIRIPTLNDLNWQPGGNADLRPELSRQMELKSNFQRSLGDLNIRLEVTLFSNWVEDWIIWLPSIEGSFWQPQNVMRVWNRGAELEADLKWSLGTWRFSLRPSYHYLRAQDLESGEELPYVSEHNFSLSFTGRYQAWYLLFQQQGRSNFWIDASNEFYMPAYGLSDVQLGWSLNIKEAQLSISAYARNLFDHAYQVIPYRPEMMRNYGLILAYQW